MRQLSTDATNEKNKKTGIEPLNILEVEWVDDSKTVYADRNLTIDDDGITAEGKIVTLSNLDEIMNVRGTSKSSSLSVTLDDSTGFIKNLLDQYDLHKRPCRLKQHFKSLSAGHAFTIFEGKINSPIEWDLANKLVSFTILSEVESNQVGFSPEEGQFLSIPDSLVGKSWPLCFGSPIHVPATKYDETASTQILNNVFLSDYTLEHKRSLLEMEVERLTDTYNYYLDVIDLVESTTDDAKVIQDRYVDAILDITKHRQEVEDLGLSVGKINTQMNEAKRKYHESTSTNVTQQYTLILRKMLNNKNYFLDKLKKASQDLSTAQGKKATQKLLYQRAKHIFKMVGKIRGELYNITDEIFDIQRQLLHINTAILDEATVVTNTIYLEDVRHFPQGNITLDLDGILLTGNLAGNTFTIHTVASNYQPTITVNNTLSGSDYFYLPDDTNDYTGLNLLVDDNYVVNVTKQEGTKCYFNAVELPTLDVFKDAELDYSDVKEETIKVGLQDFLDGTENSQVLQIRANEIPQDLAPPVWKKIHGETNRKQVVRLLNHENLDFSPDSSNSYWTAFYMGVESDKLGLTAAQVQLALKGFMYKTATSIDKLERLRLTFQNIKVTGGPLDEGKALVIEFPEAESENFPFTVFMHPLLPNDSALVTEDTTKRPPKIVISTPDEEGAHKYTLKKREKLEEDYVSSSPDLTPEYVIVRTAAENLLKQIKESSNGQTAHLWRMFQRHMSEIIRLQRDLVKPMSREDDANRALSESEENDLLSLEILSYLKWRRSITPILPTKIEEERTNRYYISGQEITTIYESSPVIIDRWLTNVGSLTPYERARRIYSLPSGGLRTFPMGTAVKLKGDYQEKFIANILPSTVRAVYAYRTINGRKSLVPVPSSYYIKNESENFGIFNATTIKLIKPLNEFVGENWENEIYVTLTSSVGPNFADICQHIVETYTDITVDSTTFDLVSTNTEKYPCNFAVLNRPDALQFLDEISWQARCSFWTDYGKAYLRYLPANPTSVSTITESDIVSGTSHLTFTRTEDIITKMVGEWRTNYAQKELNRSIVRNNISKYGESETTKEIFIYNNKELVDRTVTYWAVQYGNSWKQVDCYVFLNNIQVQTMDCVTLSLGHDHYTTNETVKALVEKADYDTNNFRVNLTLRLPIIFGQMTEFPWMWPQTVETIYPTDELVLAGNVGSLNNFGGSLGGLQPTNRPSSLNDIMIVPQDFGVMDQSDTNLIAPDVLANIFTETDYNTSSVTQNQQSLAEQKQKRDERIKKMKEKQQEKLEQNENAEDFIDEDSPITVDVAETEQTLKFLPFSGRVKKYLQEKTEIVADILDSPEQTGETILRQYYTIERPDGTEEIAYVEDLHPEERVPQGMSVQCFYNVYFNEWTFQPAIFIAPNLQVEDL